jgi:hypothetical protein
MGQTGKEAWEKAAVCEAHAQAATNGKMKAMFRKLRDSWIQIGNARQFKDDVAANANRLNQQSGASRTRSGS